MTRLHNKMTMGEALGIFDFKSGDEITKDTIKRTFRRLAMKCHPDKNKGDKKAEAKFKLLNNAYEILSQNFDSIATITPTKDGVPTKSVGSVFVDWLKVADTKGIKNPFTTYKQGRTRNET